MNDDVKEFITCDLSRKDREKFLKDVKDAEMLGMNCYTIFLSNQTFRVSGGQIVFHKKDI